MEWYNKTGNLEGNPLSEIAYPLARNNDELII